MVTPVYITGLGMISAIGKDVGESLDALLHGRSGIGPIRLLDTLHRGHITVGEVLLSNEALADLAQVRRRAYNRTTLLALAAVREALRHARLADGRDAALLSSTTVGGMCATELSYPAFLEHRPFDPFIESHDCGHSTSTLADELGFRRFVTTISTACSSSANAILLAARLIQSNRCDLAVAGGTDALSKFTLNGFHALQILDPEPCKPFDEHRKGLTLGEGAAFLVLESERSVNSRSARPLAVLCGYANANDAFHQTASSPEGEGARQAMAGSLAAGGIGPELIDYVNAHGTGTANNDLSEGTALKRIFGERMPAFNSTKTYTGHTLGAAGAVEAAVTTLSLMHQVVFPHLRFKTPMAGLGLVPEHSLKKGMPMTYALSNSFGFGGNCTSLLLKRARPPHHETEY